MNRTFRRSAGFTLAELLIVVAIIAVLVAIAIPIFTKQLEKSRESTDAANIRAMYAEVLVQANTTGESVNVDGTQMSKVSLKQKDDDWQNDTIQNSLSDLGRISGPPQSGGTAWVSYDATSGVVIHFDGGTADGGGEGSDGGGNTPDTYHAGDTVTVYNSSLTNALKNLNHNKENLQINLTSPCDISVTFIFEKNGNKLKKDFDLREGPNELILEFDNNKYDNGTVEIMFNGEISKEDANKMLSELTASTPSSNP